MASSVHSFDHQAVARSTSYMDTSAVGTPCASKMEVKRSGLNCSRGHMRGHWGPEVGQSWGVLGPAATCCDILSCCWACDTCML